MGYKVVVVGATGNVGREMLAILAERDFPADEVVAVLAVGVELILSAAPTSSASLLSPWSLNTSGGEGDSTP